MNCISQCATLAQSDQGRRTRFFRKSSSIRLAPDAVARQARISLLAFGAYQSRGEALAFLNGHSARLHGRPLDVAGLSDEGLAAASAALVACGYEDGRARTGEASNALATCTVLTELLNECPDRGRADG